MGVDAIFRHPLRARAHQFLDIRLASFGLAVQLLLLTAVLLEVLAVLPERRPAHLQVVDGLLLGAADAAESPEYLGDAGGEGLLDDALRFEAREHVVVEALPLGGVLGGQDDLVAGEAVVEVGDGDGDLALAGTRAAVVSGERASTSDRTLRAETRVLHHDVLARLEDDFHSRGLLLDLRDVDQPTDADSARALLLGRSYVRAEGLAIIEDYARLKKTLLHFNELLEVIRRSALSSLEQTEGYKTLQTQMAALSEQLKMAKAVDRTRLKGELETVRRAVEGLKKMAVQLEDTPEWIVKGISLWIDQFMDDYVTLRLYPYYAMPDFMLIGKLKRTSFSDEDLENLLFAYGTRPNVELTVFGLVTSAPEREEAADDPRTLLMPGEPTDQQKFERAFLGAFAGMRGLEQFARISNHYPNVTVYPLAIYREISLRGDLRVE